ncbi:hypothetical protein D3C71_2115130 [compost metagenome]
MLEQPLGNQHHQNALAATLGVPNHTTFTLGYPFLCRLHALKLVLARHFLLSGVEDNEVADQIQQAGLVA